MFDIIRKALLTGVGMAAMTKEKMEDLAQELVLYGEITEKEAKDFVQQLRHRAEETQHDLESRIARSVRGVLDRMNLATKDDIVVLAQRIEALEKRVLTQRRYEKRLGRKLELVG